MKIFTKYDFFVASNLPCIHKFKNIFRFVKFNSFRWLWTGDYLEQIFVHFSVSGDSFTKNTDLILNNAPELLERFRYCFRNSVEFILFQLSPSPVSKNLNLIQHFLPDYESRSRVLRAICCGCADQHDQHTRSRLKKKRKKKAPGIFIL